MSSEPIRPFASEDCSTVVGILMASEPWVRLGYKSADWERLFNPLPQGREAYVIERDGRIAGFALLRLKFLFGDYLELFAIAEWARGHALGRRLLRYVESVTFSRGTNLFACVSDFNEPARRFYEKEGYQEIGVLSDFLIAGSSEILLRKTRGPARSHP